MSYPHIGPSLFVWPSVSMTFQKYCEPDCSPRKVKLCDAIPVATGCRAANSPSTRPSSTVYDRLWSGSGSEAFQDAVAWLSSTEDPSGIPGFDGATGRRLLVKPWPAPRGSPTAPEASAVIVRSSCVSASPCRAYKVSSGPTVRFPPKTAVENSVVQTSWKAPSTSLTVLIPDVELEPCSSTLLIVMVISPLAPVMMSVARSRSPSCRSSEARVVPLEGSRADSRTFPLAA